MNTLSTLLETKPYLWWYLKQKQTLSEKSILEHILNYGDWDDYLLVEQTFGLQKTKILFTEIKKNRRVNLRNRTIQYFEKYFQKYA